ncbi:sigma-70 family RNA polymerase sigma factor [Pseudonocardia ailaonensis]|uniref:Sigma-70 family RNA polymerase sigma factor n=1 Tax=Pseudonocardia ailaonensis TaxID=367279 RepID=A0ABN2NJ40_9PSEU
MTDDELLARRFEASRTRLGAVAYRMLGSTAEADDAVQEAWLRLTRADPDAIDNLDGWLTTVVSRVCLDMLRSRGSRREQPLGDTNPAHEPVDSADPAREAELADAVGPALLVVLETLQPAERLAFVLHDLFAVPFEEVAAIVGRSPAAARQLASRARRRVRGSGGVDDPGEARRRAVVDAFLAASREGDFQGLLDLLDPEAVIRADGAAVAMGAEEIVRGAAAVAQTFSGRAKGARFALVDGIPGAVWSMGGAPKVVFLFTVDDGLVSAVELLSDPDTLAALEFEYL